MQNLLSAAFLCFLHINIRLLIIGLPDIAAFHCHEKNKCKKKVDLNWSNNSDFRGNVERDNRKNYYSLIIPFNKIQEV